jgi:hypothetical protein
LEKKAKDDRDKVEVEDLSSDEDRDSGDRAEEIAN